MATPLRVQELIQILQKYDPKIPVFAELAGSSEHGDFLAKDDVSQKTVVVRQHPGGEIYFEPAVEWYKEENEATRKDREEEEKLPHLPAVCLCVGLDRAVTGAE